MYFTVIPPIIEKNVSGPLDLSVLSTKKTGEALLPLIKYELNYFFFGGDTSSPATASTLGSPVFF